MWPRCNLRFTKGALLVMSGVLKSWVAPLGPLGLIKCVNTAYGAKGTLGASPLSNLTRWFSRFTRHSLEAYIINSSLSQETGEQVGLQLDNCIQWALTTRTTQQNTCDGLYITFWNLSFSKREQIYCASHTTILHPNVVLVSYPQVSKWGKTLPSIKIW